MGKSSYKLNSPVNNDGQNITPCSRNMEKVKELLNALFVKPEDGDDAFHVHKDRADGNKLGQSTQSGIGWTILRSLAAIVFGLCHLIVAIIFITFYVSAMILSVTLILSLSLEMLTPPASTKSKQDLLTVCQFFLVIFLTINLCMILSNFWEVVKAPLFKKNIPFNIARYLFMNCLLTCSGAWAAYKHGASGEVSLLEFTMTTAKLSWCFAFGCCILGTLILRVAVFTERVRSKVALFAYLVVVAFALFFAVLGPVSIAIVANNQATPTKAIVAATVLPFVTILTVTSMYFRGKDNDGKRFIYNKGVCLFFIGLFFFTVISTLYLTSSATCSGACRDAARRNLKNIAYCPDKHYQICSLTWTSSEVNAAELAFLANLTYNRAVETGNATRIQELANNFFTNRSIRWTVNIHTKSYQKIVHLQHKTTNIIAIKGPVTTTEFVRDATLWVEVGILKAVGSILPFLENFPDDFISYYASYTSFIQKLVNYGRNDKAFQEIEELVKETNTNNNDVILVGHSLAGGIAKIIGARQQLPAVSFSSPGIAYGHVKFGFSLEDAFKTVVSVSPQNDVFSMLDKNAGIEQRIKCNAKASEQCHLISMTYCELHNACGQGTAECEWMMDN